MKSIRIVLVGTAAFLAARGDDNGTGPPAGADMSTYVAMGTSVSMGYTSDGVNAVSQQNSWPRLLASSVGIAFTLPLIDVPGCMPPLAAPLALFRRVDNSSALPSSVCSPNSAGVSLPARNVAISGATANSAVNATGGTGQTLRARVLGPTQTQVTAMRAQNPTFVSVEFGANELLPALSGLVQTGVTTVSLASFSADYQTIVDNVSQSGADAVLALVAADLAKFPALRLGPEIASQRALFVALNVLVNGNCDASVNYVTIPVKVLSAVAAGAARAGSGLGPADLSCADVPGTADGVLTPADITALNALASQMNAFITTKASEKGFATFSLGALYDTAKDGVPFSVAALIASDAHSARESASIACIRLRLATRYWLRRQRRASSPSTDRSRSRQNGEKRRLLVRAGLLPNLSHRFRPAAYNVCTGITRRSFPARGQRHLRGVFSTPGPATDERARG
ncbi:MAG: hypothetical protein H0U59_03195 [Gemmatimonadaceae bacterium]|nr:hypothetical protein [Gemmatimonadaceae bacterium]